MNEIQNEGIIIRSEREILPYFWRRVFPVVPLVYLLVFFYLIFMIESVAGGEMPFLHILIVSPFPSILPIGLATEYLRRKYFDLDTVEHDENGLTLSRKPNALNRKTWILTLPFSGIARMRLNGDHYDVVRTDRTVVSLPKGEGNIVAYLRAGRAFTEFVEAETGEIVPFQTPGSKPPPEPGIDHLKNAELRATLEQQNRFLQGLFSPGIFIVIFLIIYGGVMTGDLIYHQNVDGGNLSCFGILFVLLVIIIVLARKRWDEAQITKTALGPDQHEEYHRDHMILVSRPVESGKPVPPEPVPMGLFALAGPFGPREHHAPERWMGFPISDSTTQMEGVLLILHGLLILPMFITGAALFFQIVRVVDHLMNDSSGIGGLLESILLPFTLGLFVVLVLLITLRFHLGLKLLLPRMTGDNPIIQAIEDRYWGLAHDHHGEGKEDSEISEERIDQVAGETEEGTTEKEVDGNDQEN